MLNNNQYQHHHHRPFCNILMIIIILLLISMIIECQNDNVVEQSSILESSSIDDDDGMIIVEEYDDDNQNTEAQELQQELQQQEQETKESIINHFIIFIDNSFNLLINNLRFIYNYFYTLSLSSNEDLFKIINNLYDNHSSSISTTIIMLIYRIETIFAIIIIVLIITTIIYHKRNVIQQPPMTQSAQSHHSSILHYLNITLLISYIITAIDSTIKSYFEHHTIVNQYQSGHSAAAYSMQGRRNNMEDCFSIHNDIENELGIEYYSVFDGHGGPNAALYAEKEIYNSVVKRIKDSIYNNDDNADDEKLPTTDKSSRSSSGKNFKSLTLNKMKTILNDEIIAVDKLLVETFQRRSDISGSTALIAIRILHSNKLLVANVGDSRGILCDSKGATIPLSFDHKPYQLKEYRRILDAGGYISLKGVYRVNGILAISRALGDYPLKDNRLIIPDPDILTFDLNEIRPKFIIMATDGFWDTFSNEQAVQFVNNELSMMYPMNEELSDHTTSSSVALMIAKKLAKEAFNRESYDNITVIVIIFNNDNFCTSKCSSVDSSATCSSSSSPIKNKNQDSSSSSKPAIHS